MSATAQIIRLTKTCSSCGEAKDFAEFHRRYANPDGRRGCCKVCDSRIRIARYKQEPSISRDQKERRDLRRIQRGDDYTRLDDSRRSLKTRYGLTLDAAREMLRSQYGLCANRACGKPISLDVHGHRDMANKAVIDHCHATGRVRGILCHKCNTSAGLLEKNRNLFVGLSEYLAKGE